MRDDGHKKVYFVNRWVDAGFIGLFSIVAFLLLRQFSSGARTAEVYQSALLLSWFINWPHFSATNYRLYQSRENINQYPITALLVPPIILLAVWGSFALPLQIAPYFIKTYMIWSPFHFCGQSVGITLLYARRGGLRIPTWARLGLASFIFGTFVVPTLKVEANIQGSSYFGISYPGLGVPGWTAGIATGVMWVGAAVFLIYLARLLFEEKVRPPLILILPCVTQYIWFVAGSNWASFREFVPAFHGLQYLFIAWMMQLKERLDHAQASPSSKFVYGESLKWFILNMVGGGILFYGLPRIIASTGADLMFCMGVIHAAIQIHHFFVDGVIWKLKSKSVSSPLMVSLKELVGPIKQLA